MPIDPSRLLVVVPALNEEDAVGAVVNDVRSHLPGIRVVVIDDGSVDRTAAVAAAAGAEVLRLPINLGVGGAMRAGFRFAQAQGHDIVVQVDADGQHDVTYLPALLERLDEADVVIGARFAGLDDYGVRGPRRWAQWVLARSMSVVVRRRLTDVTSGFKAMGPRAVTLYAHTYPAEYLGDTVEALVIGARAGLRITQVPVRMRARQGGQPSQGAVRSTVYLARAGVAFVLALMRPRVRIELEETR